MFKVSTKEVAEDKGIVYLLEIHLEDKVLVKIGVTARLKISDRVLEILLGIFNKYREFPYCRPKRFRTTEGIFEKEKILHEYFSKYRYSTKHKFGGSTEFFDIPLDHAVDAYEKVLSNIPLDKEYDATQSK